MTNFIIALSVFAFITSMVALSVASTRASHDDLRAQARLVWNELNHIRLTVLRLRGEARNRPDLTEMG